MLEQYVSPASKIVDLVGALQRLWIAYIVAAIVLLVAFYITNGGPQGTITFPRPVIIRSIRVSSGSSTTFTLVSSGNPNVSLTTSGSNPQTLTTGWTTAVTSPGRARNAPSVASTAAPW